MPTPMPILAPVDNPLDPDSEFPEPAPDVVLVVGSDWPAVFVVVAPVESVVMVAETNRLESLSRSCTCMGCAHMVIGPVTWVLSWET